MAHDPRLPFQRRTLPAGVGQALRAAREGRGWTRRDVAAAAGIRPRTLARIERGAQKPLWPTLERLCEEFGVSTFAVARTWAAQAMDLPEVAAGAGVSAATLSLRARDYRVAPARPQGRRTGGGGRRPGRGAGCPEARPGVRVR